MALAEIGIEELEIVCIIGDLPEERKREQSLFLTVCWLWDCTKVAESDDLRDTVDYTAVAERSKEIAVKGKFRMIEALGEALAVALIEEFKLQEVSITLRKPAALAQSYGSSFRLKRRVEASCPTLS